MGIRNSSRTRVAPIFERLYARDSTGRQWLPTLLTLGERTTEVSILPAQPTLIPNHQPTWGDTELSLDPPTSLLEYLVQNVTVERVDKSGDKGLVLQKRQLLARKDAMCIEEALAAIRSGARGRHWYVLEGPSCPDATLIMDEAVLVVEGKRTERSCTSQTKWMTGRSQLLRHMDAAMEKFSSKRVFGLLIVEGNGGAEAVSPSSHWLSESAAQSTAQMLTSSLPHRSQAVRDRLAEGILGVSTWQALCAACKIKWPPHP